MRNNFNVLMIVGSYPPDMCGVGDYTYNLMNSSKANKWKLYYSKEWNLNTLFNKISEINKFKPEIIILQYPTQGYGWSIVPHILCILYSAFSSRKFVTVLHELSNQSLKAKIAEYIFLLFSNRIIVTNDFEKKYAISICPFIVNRRISVARIYSNIKAVSIIPKTVDRSIDLVYFGHIRPNKGINEFINFIQELRNKNLNYKVALIGQVLPEYAAFYNELASNIRQLNINTHINKTSEEVSILLSDSKFAFFPFPDGLSERRGSFIAAALNGVIMISTIGKHTTANMISKIPLIDNNNLAFEKLLELVNMSPEELQNIQSSVLDYVDNFIPKSWDEVVEQYKLNIQ